MPMQLHSPAGFALTAITLLWLTVQLAAIGFPRGCDGSYPHCRLRGVFTDSKWQIRGPYIILARRQRRLLVDRGA